MQVRPEPTPTIRVEVSEEFVIALASNPTTGYSWRATTDARSLALVSQQYEPVGEGIGAGGREVFRFRAQATGETEICFEYRRPWEKTARDTRRFRVEIG